MYETSTLAKTKKEVEFFLISVIINLGHRARELDSINFDFIYSSHILAQTSFSL